MLNRIQRSTLFKPILLGSFLIFLFIAYAYFSGKIADFFLGEEYYVLGNAAVYPHHEAWWRYFLANGRLIEGIYWTYLYKFLDFSPALMRVFSYGLVYLGSLLATISVSRVWPKKDTLQSFTFTLLILSFFAPHAINWANKLSGDNSRLAIVFFWFAVLMLQQWMANKFQSRYLVGAILLQFFSIFTYENAVFLFPAGILLAIPLLPAGEITKNNGKRVKQFSALGIASMFFILVPFAIYLVLAKLPGVYLSHYAISGTVNFSGRILAFFPNFGHYLLSMANTDVTERGVVGLIYFGLVIMGLVAVIYHRFYQGTKTASRRGKIPPREEMTYTILFLAALWILIFGISIWGLLGTVVENPTRVYVAAMMGFPIMLSLLFYLVPTRLWRMPVLIAMLIWVQSAYVEFEKRTERSASLEKQYNDYLLSIYELVPDVRPNTWFVFVDFELGNSGCGPSLSMLYEEPDLFCAFLSTTNPRYIADRYSSDLLNVRNTGGWIRNGNTIIFGIDPQGAMYIIPAITPEDNIYINWVSNDPIKSDFRRIVINSSKELSPMAKKLLERRQILLLN